MADLVDHPRPDPERGVRGPADREPEGRLLTDSALCPVAPPATSPLRGAAWLAALLVAAWVLWRHSPEDPLLPIVCPMYAFTGLHCPGCGTMRGLHAVLHGRFLEGLGHNPLAVVVVPGVLAGLASDVRRAFTGRPLPLPDLPQGVVRAVPWVLVVYTVARNLPWAPFTWLAP